MGGARRFLGRDGDAGQAIVLIAIFLLALMMIIGLAVDAGQLYSAKRSEQEAADSAAFAGAVVLYQGGTALQAYAAAVNDATRNGFTDGVASTTVTVNIPPLKGLYVGNANYTEVEITRQVTTSLVPAEAAFNPVRARGVGGAEPLNNGFAIMALDRGNTSNAFYADLNADIHLSGGGIQVNSTSATAAVNGQTSATRFTISGSPNSVDVAGGSGSAWPVPMTPGSPQVPDPFAGYPKPDITKAPYNALPICSALNSPGCQDALGNQNPGIYTTAMTANGNVSLTLNSGVYILEAGWSDSGNGNLQSAPGGVFVFNTLNSYPNSGGTCGALAISGNGVINLSPMTTGTYTNMLVYQDPACTATATIAGNGSLTAGGTIYVPNAQFVFNGNNATLTGSQLVAKTVTVQGGNVNITFSAGSTAQPILPRLAE